MSLYGALRSGVSGLFSNSQRMGMISDNIANVNTTGYKRVDARFSTFVTSNSSGTGAYSTGGVINYNSREIAQQGGIEATAFTTDMAISGNGYFIVAGELQRDGAGEFQPTGDTFFTRSGEFRVDNNGNLRNSEGYYLLSWPANEAGTDFIETNEFSSMAAVNVGNQSFDPAATTEFDLGVNVIPSTDLGAANAFSVTQEVIDPQGRARTMTFNFERTPSVTHNVYLSDGVTTLDKAVNLSVPNSWRVYASVEDASLRTFDQGGSFSALVDDSEQVAIADVMFDATGRLSAITPPGSINLFYRTELPMAYTSLDGITSTPEVGSISTSRYTIPAGATAPEVAARNAARDILQNSGVTVPATATASEILAAIDTLDTDDYPLAMGEIMGALATATAFQDTVNRPLAGLPLLDGSIDDLFALSYTAPMTGNPSLDPLGALSLGTSGALAPQYLAGRIVDADGEVRTLERTIGGNTYEHLQGYNTAANDKLRIELDYDNSNATDSDQTSIDINLGSLTQNAFDGNNVLNRSATRISTVGTGMLGNDGVTQYSDTLSTLRFTEHNGRRFSALQTVDITEDGVVEGFYDNGETRNLYKIPLVTFANPNGLNAASGNVFEQTNDSGIALTRVASTSGTGRILNSAREAAAVDLAEEFSNMIVTQRAYSAATKIITTTDSMLDELTRAVR